MRGLMLSWTKAQIVQKFGEPTKVTWDARTFGYAGFGVMVGGRREEIWHFTINGPEVRLASGIGVGSSAADVVRVFGQRSSVTVDQYALTFKYDGDRVTTIKIDPANGSFTALPSGETGKAGNAGKIAQPVKSNSLVGTWYGANFVGQIEVNANGMYTSQNSGSGRWRMDGNDVVFTGSLVAWNNGRATLNKGNLEFYWTTPAGAKQYFALVRRD
jgi:hypothetical protein